MEKVHAFVAPRCAKHMPNKNAPNTMFGPLLNVQPHDTTLEQNTTTATAAAATTTTTTTI